MRLYLFRATVLLSRIFTVPILTKSYLRMKPDANIVAFRKCLMCGLTPARCRWPRITIHSTPRGLAPVSRGGSVGSKKRTDTRLILYAKRLTKHADGFTHFMPLVASWT